MGQGHGAARTVIGGRRFAAAAPHEFHLQGLVALGPQEGDLGAAAVLAGFAHADAPETDLRQQSVIDGRRRSYQVKCGRYCHGIDKRG